MSWIEDKAQEYVQEVQAEEQSRMREINERLVHYPRPMELYDSVVPEWSTNVDRALVLAARRMAPRVAATWNACVGIPVEALEAGMVRRLIELVEKVVSEYNKAEEEQGAGRVSIDSIVSLNGVLHKLGVRNGGKDGCP